MEKISVIVPCCNVEKYVRECLDSIKVQTYTNIEVICIDDGSKDGTGAIIDEFVASDKRFKAIHKPNTGYGDSMNIGLNKCTGDYVGIVESDDWIEPNMFETLLKAATDHNLDLVRCCWYEGPTGTEREEHQDWVEKGVVCCPIEYKNRDEIFLQQPSIWVALYKRELLESGRKIRFLPTPGASYQDASFAFKTYTKSKRFMMLDTALHHYRINPNSSVSSSGKAFCILDEWEEMRRWVCEDPTLYKAVKGTPLLARIWQGGLIWNYERLSFTTLKLLFLRKASQFFRQASEDGILLLGKRENCIQKVMDSPLDFHHDNITSRLKILSKYTKSFNKTPKEQEEKDLISVVVTCYNTSKYIYSSLQSILQQSYRNIEIICVDDCSTDDTKILVHHLMRVNPRIVWLSTKQNSGLSSSRNLGLAHCHGEYVLFVDGDDCLTPDAIALLHTSMEKTDDVVAGSILVLYEGGEAQYGPLVESDRKYYTNKEEKRLNALTEIEEACKTHVSACGKLWRLSAIRKFGICFPDGLLYEDACFFWKYLCVAPKLHIIPDPVYLYQRHLSGSIMSDTFKQKPGMAIQHVLILDDIYHFAETKNRTAEIKRVLNKLYEPFFWFAYNNSPESDYTLLCENICRILNAQQADTSTSSILSHLANYEETSKGELFLKAFTESVPTRNVFSPSTNRIYKKLKKYRRLTKIFAITSILLLILLIITGLISL